MLRHQNVKTLKDAIFVAEALVDFWVPVSSTLKNYSELKGFKAKKRIFSKVNQQKPPKPKKMAKEQQSTTSSIKTPITCFICDGPHYMKIYPKRARVAALVAKDNQEPELVLNPVVVSPVSSTRSSLR